MRPTFNVIFYDITKKEMVPYNVFGYLYSEYDKLSQHKKPKTFNEFKEFIKNESMFVWWGRCEYEIVLSSWPNETCKEKWDIWKQIKLNLDNVTFLFMDGLKLDRDGNKQNSNRTFRKKKILR